MSRAPSGRFAGEKLCNSCGNFEKFYANASSGDGLQTCCIKCFSKMRKAIAAADPARALFDGAKQRAGAQGIEFRISKRDVIIPRICPILGIQLERSVGMPGSGSPSLDRIDPRRGYVPGNVWVISHRANMLKSDALIDEIRTLARELPRKSFWAKSLYWLRRAR